MNSTQSGSPVEWLLEPDNPSVRYFTLTDLLGKSPLSEEVIRARSAIMESGVVPEILSHLGSNSYWGDSKRFYTDKYRGTVWQLMMLAELGADGKHPGIAAACEFILKNSQEAESGGFSTYKSEKTGGGLPGYVIPCLTGNLVWSLIRLGYSDHPQVRKGISWINTYQRFDDGMDEIPKGWPYDRYQMCWGRHSCHMGAAKALKALAEIPAGMQSAADCQTIDAGVEYFLAHHIYKKSHDLESVAKPGWMRLGFPLMYQSDILEILDILTRLNIRDQRMEDALDILMSKRGDSGRWNMENSFNGKFLVDIEKKGKQSKWITLKALRILNWKTNG